MMLPGSFRHPPIHAARDDRVNPGLGGVLSGQHAAHLERYGRRGVQSAGAATPCSEAGMAREQALTPIVQAACAIAPGTPEAADFRATSNGDAEKSCGSSSIPPARSLLQQRPCIKAQLGVNLGGGWAS